jgi:hypothetical protein
MEKKKIGFFETWNKTSQQVEKSSTRLQQFLTLLFIFVFTILYLRDNPVSIDFIILDLMFLIGAFAPKYLKDFIDLKEKLNK